VNLMLAMWTRLLLRLYRDRIALNKGILHSWSVHHGGHGRMPSPGPPNTCGPVVQIPMNPRAPCKGCRAGPVFKGQDENHTAPPEAKVEHQKGDPTLPFNHLFMFQNQGIS
ncbi:hypothetical protein XENOCAPTIV_005547, partial [Xenoophorus captivus]